MFRAVILPIFRSNRLCDTACGTMHSICGRPHIECIIPGVPLATAPGIYLIILTPMKILQRNLNRSTFVVWEMKRNVSVVYVCSALNCCNILISGKIIKEMPGSVVSGTHCTTSCITQSNTPEDGQNNCPKCVELIEITNKQLLLHLVRYLLDYVILIFLGAVAKLQKAIIRFVMSVCPSCHPSFSMEELGSHWMHCHNIWSLI
jgi:hypothetical protein